MVKRRRVRCSYKDCNKDYYNIYNLKRHVELKHLFLQLHTCPTCDKQLASKQNLDEHISTHDLSKPYRCPFSECNQMFRQASLLSVHKKVHRMLIEQVLDRETGNKELQASAIKMEDLYQELAHEQAKSGWQLPFKVMPPIKFDQYK